MNSINCELCGNSLMLGEAFFCVSCQAFIEWKYGSVEKYLIIRNKNIGGKGK